MDIQRRPAPPEVCSSQAYNHRKATDLLKSDVGLVLRRSPLIPLILWPFFTTSSPLAELYFPSIRVLIASFEQVVLAIASLISIASTLFFLTNWGLGAIVTVLVSWAFFWLALAAQGRLIIRAGEEWMGTTKGEKWFYVNGVCTGKYWATQNVKLLSKIFHRPVTGVHNRTLGILFDLVECLVQRDFGYATQETSPELYQQLRTPLLDVDTTKVVLIAHSQGGIIASLVLDWLLADIPQINLRKLEVYTFANGANHFNNPVVYRATESNSNSGSSSSGSENDASGGTKAGDSRVSRNGGLEKKKKKSGETVIVEHVIPHIEHFANGRDFVASIGVIHFQPIQNNVFYGPLYLRPDRTGHLLNEHYLLPGDFSPTDWLEDPKEPLPRLFAYRNGGSPGP